MLKKMRKQIVSLGLFGAVTVGTFLPGLAVSPVYALEKEEGVTEATEVIEEINATEPTEATGAAEGALEAGAIPADPDNEPEADAAEDEALTVQSEEATENNIEGTAGEVVDTKENVKSFSGVGETKSGAENADSVKTEQVKNGWVKENGGYSYYDNGTKYTGWHYMTSKEGEKTPHWSFFGNDGRIRTGWVQLGEGTSNPDGNAAKHWSYFGDNGWLRTGWVQLGKGTSNPDGNAAKHWSYFGDNGWLRTGWVQLGEGTSNPDGNAAKHWSYFGDNGWLRTGWVQLGKGTSNPDGNTAKHWSFFGDNGWLRTGWVQLGKGTINPDGNAAKHWSYFGDNGWLRTGWVQLGKGTANPDGNSAKHWSYFGDNGWLRTEWVQFGKGTSEPDGNSARHWSYFGPNGWLRTGWQDMGKGTANPDGNSAKHRSYFGDNGWLITGEQYIGGKQYTFDSRGWLISSHPENDVFINYVRDKYKNADFHEEGFPVYWVDVLNDYYKIYLDYAIADFDGDGQNELLIHTYDRVPSGGLFFNFYERSGDTVSYKSGFIGDFTGSSDYTFYDNMVFTQNNAPFPTSGNRVFYISNEQFKKKYNLWDGSATRYERSGSGYYRIHWAQDGREDYISESQYNNEIKELTSGKKMNVDFKLFNASNLGL